eukprot:s4416_g2.t1
MAWFMWLLLACLHCTAAGESQCGPSQDPSCAAPEELTMQMSSGQKRRKKKYDCTRGYVERVLRPNRNVPRDGKCTGLFPPDVKEPAQHCMPAWFQSDDEAAAWFRPAEANFLAIRDYNILYSFGSGNVQPNGLAYEVPGRGFANAKRLAQRLHTARGDLNPYIDALVLPTLDGSYRLQRNRYNINMARNVLWKQYYQAMMGFTKYMVFLVDQFWLESKNCQQELEWALTHFGWIGEKLIAVVFIGKDDDNKLIWRRAKKKSDCFGSLEAGGVFTPCRIQHTLRCAFAKSGKRAKVKLYFSYQQSYDARLRHIDPTQLPFGPGTADCGSDPVTRRNTPAKGKPGAHWLDVFLKDRRSQAGLTYEQNRKALFVTAAGASLAAGAFWSRAQEHYEVPSPAPDQEQEHEVEVEKEKPESKTFSVKKDPKKDPKKDESSPTGCLFWLKSLPFGKRKGGTNQGRTQGPSGPSTGKKLKPTDRTKQKLAAGYLARSAVNVLQKEWVEKFITHMSFDVCQKRFSFGNPWGEDCLELPSARVYNYSCGFAGRYCAKDVWGCRAKHGMNLIAIAGVIPAFGPAFKAGRFAFKVGRKAAMLAFRTAVKKAARSIVGQVKTLAIPFMKDAFKEKAQEIVMETTMDALLKGGATSVAAKVEAKRNEAFEWIKDAVQLLDPIGAWDLWDELKEENCASLTFPDMPGGELQDEECYDCADEQVVSGPLRSEHDGRCLDYHTGTGNVFLTSCHGRANQEWYFDGMTLKSKFDDKCLDYNQVGSGGSVYMYDCHGGDHQNWRFDGKTLKTLYAENCVDYNYRSHDAYVLECHGKKNQQWTWQPRVSSGPLRTLQNSKKCLDFNTNEGGQRNVQMWDCHDIKDATYQDWYFDGQLLKSKYDHTCLDFNFATGNVYMLPCHGEDNQLWHFDERALKTLYDDTLCLDYDYDGNHNAAMAECQQGKRSQQWQWDVQVSSGNLATRRDSKCLDYNPSNDRVYMHGCHDEANQMWYFEGKALKTKYSNKCLDYSDEYVSDEHGKWSGNIFMGDCNGSPSQQWYFDGEALKTVSANNCLDYHVQESTVFMYQCHGEINQKWQCFFDGCPKSE